MTTRYGICETRGDSTSALNSPHTIQLISCRKKALPHWKVSGNRLSASTESMNVFTTYDWFRAWTERAISEEGAGRIQPHVLLIKRQGEVMGVAPLVRRVISRFGFSLHKLEFATYHSDYNDLVVGKDVRALTRGVMKYLADNPQDWDLIDLKELRHEGSRIVDSNAAALSTGILCCIYSELDGCPFLPIDGPWSEIWKSRKLNFAQRVVRRIGARAEDGFRIRVVEQPPLENGLLDRIIEIESQKRIGGQPLEAFVGKYREVFQSLFESLSGPRGLMSIVLIERNAELVAYMILVQVRKETMGLSDRLQSRVFGSCCQAPPSFLPQSITASGRVATSLISCAGWTTTSSGGLRAFIRIGA